MRIAVRISILGAGLALLVGVTVLASWPSEASEPAPGPAHAPQQLGLPERPQNLQVLPTDLSTQAVVRLMRRYATGLGVRCTHCHVGDDPTDLRTIDFASDALETKQIARVMIGMVDTINQTQLTKLGDRRGTPALEVRCATCHHGQARPVPLDMILMQVYKEQGFDEMLAEYHALREQYYGSWVYDFSLGTLSGMASRLAERGDGPAALALVDLNEEFFPEHSFVLVNRAQVHEVLGNIEEARAAYLACHDLDPDNGWCLAKARELSEQ